ncbi:hypothetical protein NGM36_13165, partial [Streptomyces mutabilis]|nr:hypothetical protein [Streptomyces mutabilis]
MNTYLTGRGHIGHYKQPGSHLTYCGRTAGAPGVGTRMCRPCVKAEARDHAEAQATANAWRDQAETEAEVAEQFRRVALTVDAVEHAERVEARVETVEDAEALYAAALVTEAEATAGTWRGEWIGETDTAGALFSLTPNREQGA